MIIKYAGQLLEHWICQHLNVEKKEEWFANEMSCITERTHKKTKHKNTSEKSLADLFWWFHS